MNDERKLREILKAGRKEADKNMFFTRKVLNRLPEKRWRRTDIFLLTLYSICFIITFAVWGRFILDTEIFIHGKLEITVSDIIFFFAFAAVMFMEVWMTVKLIAKE